MLIKRLLQNLSEKLERASITKNSTWTEKYRYINNALWKFDYHPWLRDIHDSEEEWIAVQKAAQVGVTEAAMNRTFAQIDLLKQSILYLLPTTKPGANDFSTTRFDPALEQSAYLKNLFSDTKNVGVKRSGSTILYVRGAGTAENVKSLPVGHIIFDEIEEMDDEIVRLALERVSGQMQRTSFFMLSTPKIEGSGINRYFKDSSQDHFMFKCPSCSLLTELTLECLIIVGDEPHTEKVKESYLECKECHNKLPHQTKKEWLSTGRWVPNFTGKSIRGFYINQLYSSTPACEPWKLANYYLEGQMDPVVMREFYNSKMGLTFTEKGGRVENFKLGNYVSVNTMRDAIINKITGEGTTVTMGVDVGGKRLHVVVAAWENRFDAPTVNSAAYGKVLLAIVVADFRELDRIMLDFNIDYAVIDAGPETRASLAFCERMDGRAKRCYYAGKKFTTNDEEYTVTLDRTAWLDQSLGRIIKEKIEFPKDLLFEFKENVRNMHRIIELDKDGDQVARWIHQGPDHFGHALNYAEIALKLAVGQGEGEDIYGIH